MPESPYSSSDLKNKVFVVYKTNVYPVLPNIKMCFCVCRTAKYNFVSFIPKFLFEQFRRYSNVFFLFIALLQEMPCTIFHKEGCVFQQIPNVSPTGRYTTAVPLFFILAVSALKEIVEDFVIEMNPLDQPSTSKGLGSEVHLDEDILEYLYDSGSEIDDEVKDPDYENSASDELEFEEEEREEIPAKRPRLEVAPVRMLTTCRDTSTAAAGSNVAAGTWRKDDPSPPTPPPFTARPGLNLVGDVSSPFDAFSLFFTENIFKSIKEETNRYARSIIDRESKKGPLKPHGMLAKWKAVSVAQIKLFFCVIIHMSLVKKPGMKDYWSTHGFLKNAFCQSINMPRTLFMRILSMLHLNDNSKYIEYGKPGHDRLFKIRPVLESFIYSFGNAYTPQQNLTIDEAMCPFRGRICEAVSGYAYNLDIYTGKDPEQPEHNSIPNLVDRLAKRFYGQGYHIYFDRWFSSPELFDKLWEKKTLAVGTVMPSRKTMPKTEFSQKLKRGEIIKMRRKHLLAIKWKDVRDVFMLSTVHEGKMMPVKPKTPTREELFKPDAVIDYTKGKWWCAALRGSQWEMVRWSNLVVGDIVKVTSGQFFPADLVLLSSSEPQAMCYIETSNLDGETNLKIRQGLPQTADFLTTKDMVQLTGAVECELPNRHLYEFTGNLRITSRLPLPLGPDQILLRGARLRNTNWIFGGLSQKTSFNQVNRKISIPNDLAGAIIGKGGQRIRKIRRESGAGITIDESQPGSNERVITISGTPQQIQMAQYLLQQNVREHSFRKRYNRNAKPLSHLEVGAIVLVQDHRTKHWTLLAKVLEQLPRGRSYLIRTDAGRLLRRNRRFLRPFVPPPYTTPPNSAQHQQTLSPRTREPNPRYSNYVGSVPSPNLQGGHEIRGCQRATLAWDAGNSAVRVIGLVVALAHQLVQYYGRHVRHFVNEFEEWGLEASVGALVTEDVLPAGTAYCGTKPGVCAGLVIYTGHETKLMMNSTTAPMKRSHVDKVINNQILMMFLLLIMLGLVSAIASEIWNSNHIKEDWYLGLDDLISSNFGYSFLTFVILYNNLIPISLQVTLELVRFIQAIFINMDMEMYHDKTDTPAMARTSNLNEELGQVKYIFSDKTGTLTRNVMVFKQCSIAGIVYGKPEAPFNHDALIANLQEKHPTAPYIREFFLLMSVCHTVVPELDLLTNQIHYQAASPDEGALVKGAKEVGFVFTTRTPSHVMVNIVSCPLSPGGSGVRWVLWLAAGQGGEVRSPQCAGVHQVQLKFVHECMIKTCSFRKRMSVIIRDSNKKIKLYCKGADSVIMERLGPDQKYRDITLDHLKSFASNGFRTLCCAVAEIPEKFYNEWKDTYHKASTSLQLRDKKLDDAAQLIETNLTLLGATAIEDKLQEGVPEAISDLQKADIKVWVLTGDKQETAINIVWLTVCPGYSCRLLSHGMPLLIVNEDSLDATRECIRRHMQDFGDLLHRDSDAAAIIIDGKTLTYALSSDVRQDFEDLALACKSVICCRVSPMQKAEVVQMVMLATQDVTLAIGDGANDVAMIQAAHVGVGISGFEGLQAACASDYAIAQFRFLTRLLFVHGAWSHARLCKLILYSFHKNICLYVIELTGRYWDVQLWFAILSGWSGQTLFERWTIGLYNVIFTAAPPVVMGLFDRTCSAETNMKFPSLYKPSQTSSYFNVRVRMAPYVVMRVLVTAVYSQVFWVWIFNAILHSILLFWLGYFSMTQDVAWSHGRDGGYLVMGNMVYTYVVVAVCLKGGLEMNAWNWKSYIDATQTNQNLAYTLKWTLIPLCWQITHVAIWGSIGSWFLFLLFYCRLWPAIPLAAEMRGIDIMVFSSGVFWMSLVIIPLITLLGDFVYKVIRRTVHKSLPEAVQESEMANADPATVILTATKQRLTETARLLKNVFRRPSTHVSHVPIEMELQPTLRKSLLRGHLSTKDSFHLQNDHFYNLETPVKGHLSLKDTLGLQLGLLYREVLL
ncbi:ATP8A1 [Cordylochernes scorpioides]|uniref:P-type phospholipid transporter n=1 Tax=Cordylochernes scorpioides TaxID=51811 RepID=A0ABY6LAS2_9ARAC|nr:ATP8A1 [Cordylochernes scorpioides]